MRQRSKTGSETAAARSVGLGPASCCDRLASQPPERRARSTASSGVQLSGSQESRARSAGRISSAPGHPGQRNQNRHGHQVCPGRRVPDKKSGPRRARTPGGLRPPTSSLSSRTAGCLASPAPAHPAPPGQAAPSICESRWPPSVDIAGITAMAHQPGNDQHLPLPDCLTTNPQDPRPPSWTRLPYPGPHPRALRPAH